MSAGVAPCDEASEVAFPVGAPTENATLGASQLLGDCPDVPQWALVLCEQLVAVQDRLEPIEAAVSGLVEFAQKLGAFIDQAAPVIEGLASGGIGGILGMLGGRRKG